MNETPKDYLQMLVGVVVMTAVGYATVRVIQTAEKFVNRQLNK